MTDAKTSDAAVLAATGTPRADWHRLLDSFEATDHADRAKQLAHAAPELDGWWVQMMTVDYERARGLRAVGQSYKGDFQVSCSKTVPWDADTCFERVVAANWLPGASWKEGATWETDGGRVEVRIVAPGKQLRFFWFDEDGKSTVMVDFWPNAAGDKMQIRFGHEGLASLEAREKYRAKWKAALAVITA